MATKKKPTEQTESDWLSQVWGAVVEAINERTDDPMERLRLAALVRETSKAPVNWFGGIAEARRIPAGDRAELLGYSNSSAMRVAFPKMRELGETAAAVARLHVPVDVEVEEGVTLRMNDRNV